MAKPILTSDISKDTLDELPYFEHLDLGQQMSHFDKFAKLCSFPCCYTMLIYVNELNFSSPLTTLTQVRIHSFTHPFTN